MKAPWPAVIAACAPVLADFERGHPGLMRLTRAAPEDSCEAFVWDTRHGGGTGLYLGDSYETEADAVAYMAGEFLVPAMEAVHGGWPPCPEHASGHPLDPDVADGVPVWVCDQNGRVVAPLGQLLPAPTAAS